MPNHKYHARSVHHAWQVAFRTAEFAQKRVHASTHMLDQIMWRVARDTASYIARRIKHGKPARPPSLLRRKRR